MSADWTMEQLYFKWFQLLFTNDRQVKGKHNESMTKQSIFVEYMLLQKKRLSFAGAHWQINTTLFQNRPGEM